MEQFLTGDIWAKANKLIKNAEKRTACIAYITSSELKLKKGDALICDASDHAIECGLTSARVLDIYFNKGVKIFSNPELHAKLLVTDSFLVIGSANLSTNSAENLVEAAVVTTDTILRGGADSFCTNLMDNDSTFIDKSKMKELLAIKVIQRPRKPVTFSRTRRKTFGNNYWFISAEPLKDSAFDRIRKHVEETNKKISDEQGINTNNIELLRWGMDNAFAKEIKEGDQLILKFSNESKTRCFIYPPATVLLKQVSDNFVHIYHDNTNGEKRKISFSNYKKFLKGIPTTIGLSNRTRKVSADDMSLLKKVWKKK